MMCLALGVFYLKEGGVYPEILAFIVIPSLRILVLHTYDYGYFMRPC